MSRRCFAQRSAHLAGPSSVAQSPLSVPRPWRAGSKSSPSPNSPVIYYSSEASCERIELAYKHFILSVPRSFLLAWLRLMSITADLSPVCPTEFYALPLPSLRPLLLTQLQFPLPSSTTTQSPLFSP